MSRKKYIVLLGDGMSDRPIDELDGKTPLEAARTPNMDRIASEGILGACKTTPDGYEAGSDVTNMGIFGYEPEKYYSGRSPLEAAAMGVELGEDDVAYRCNLVTIAERDGRGIMEDYSAGHISNEEAAELIDAVDKELGRDGLKFYPGKSYRHLLVIRGGPLAVQLTPPHDISGLRSGEYLPKGPRGTEMAELMESSRKILENHEVNAKRREAGKNPANSIWLWGLGKKPAMPSFQERYGLKGGVISAVDLMMGIAVNLGLKVIEVPGVTGYLDTNFIGKAEYALNALRELDYVYIHVEAPDEAGHIGDLKAKIQAIEDFDEKVVGTVLKGLESFDEWRVLVMPDHSTPIAIKTHEPTPVPYAMLGSDLKHDALDRSYCEKDANKEPDGKHLRRFDSGPELAQFFIKS